MPRAVIVVVVLLTLCGGRPSPVDALASDGIWYVPNPGSMDLLRMFEHPEEWSRSRQLIHVFQFTQQHTFTPPDPIVGPNYYDALVRAGVFAKLTQWGKQIALGVGAVKEFYCTNDSSGMDTSIRRSADAIRAVTAAQGRVSFLAMDEPFLSGRAPQCGGPDLEPTADRLQTYVTSIKRDFPSVQIGLIEAYPSFSPDDFRNMLDLLGARGIRLAFVQLDVDIRAVRPPRDLTADVRAIRSVVADRGIPFGLIIWGYNGDSNALFARDAHVLEDAFIQAFPTWSEMPEQISIQSWSPSATGLLLTPSNLPESQPYTLTAILLDVYRRLRGGTPARGTDTAVPRTGR